MLSKLTFSLVFVLMLVLLAGPAFPQSIIVSGNLNHSADSSGDTDPGNATEALQSNKFVVHQASGNNGIDGVVITVTATSAANFPNLEDFLSYGGTIELVLLQGDGLTGKPAKAGEESKLLYRLAITEVMWGLDGVNNSTRQWVEVYNEGPALKQGDDLRLLYTANTREARAKADFVVGSTATTIDEGTYIASLDNDAKTITYTVVDRVSLVNAYGNKWDPKGQSGRTVALPAQNLPAIDLISMYRKRSTDGDPIGYKYKDGKPDGDKFGDGTKADQWFASEGRFNMTGKYIGTPGAAHRSTGDRRAVVTKTPASLPVGTVLINEIYNSDDLQWIELHNTGTAEVDVKKHELEAAFVADAKNTLQRVFLIPDKATKIPAGGYLVITNVNPVGKGTQRRLAAGDNLYDNNEDPTGATHRYIVIEKAGDNKWMPEKDFLLVLRSENKDNHEKIVDIAGNKFIEDNDEVTKVWPLRAWDKPGDVADGDWGGKDNSLGQNAGMTYARVEDKSNANRLHNENWAMAGMMGGLGYDPDADLAISPGTPGYPNKAPDKIIDAKGKLLKDENAVVISEIMYDSGENGNLVQWIELYNASMTNAVNLSGWQLEVRNIDTDVESYVDSSFTFDANTIILPNQTLLLVSDRSSAKSEREDLSENRVYNLYQRHRNELGLIKRRSILLSSDGFYIALRDKDADPRKPHIFVDAAGNVELDGPRRNVMWPLPEADGIVRHSIIRKFGDKLYSEDEQDENSDRYAPGYDGANDGTMADSWVTAKSTTTYYGHRDDVGSPGARLGSPLPVSLSSFRPVRDKTTGQVIITWVTESELNNAGFNILRSETKTGAFKVVNVKGIIAGHGTTSEKHVYTFTDATAKPNVVYYYQIEDVSLDGNRTTLATTHLRGNVNAAGKLTTTWGDLKSQE